jgi:23S rRNA pseudouridine2605 synthase
MRDHEGVAKGTRRGGRVPLARALSKLGIASRTEARRLIEAGRVTVRGRVITDPQHIVVSPEQTPITVDGQPHDRPTHLTIMLHKPRGVVTTRSDPEGRSTVYDYIRDAGTHLIPVGRLDLASTGLLLFTNDTRLADRLTDPKSHLVREYVVTVRGRLEDDAALKLERGLTIDSEHLQAKRVVVKKRSSRETHLIVELVEGKNREIRRLMKAVGHEVTRLMRVSFGGLQLGTLAPGRWRVISEEELATVWRDK